jgi:hypothetical protein
LSPLNLSPVDGSGIEPRGKMHDHPSSAPVSASLSS